MKKTFLAAAALLVGVALTGCSDAEPAVKLTPEEAFLQEARDKAERTGILSDDDLLDIGEGSCSSAEAMETLDITFEEYVDIFSSENPDEGLTARELTAVFDAASEHLCS